MDAILEYLAARMKEPSTYASLGVLLTAVGVNISPEYWQAIMGVCMGFGGLIGVILQERKKTTPVEIKQVVEAVVKPSALDKPPPTKAELNTAMAKGTDK